jgi:hypothetical protein
MKTYPRVVTVLAEDLEYMTEVLNGNLEHFRNNHSQAEVGTKDHDNLYSTEEAVRITTIYEESLEDIVEHVVGQLLWQPDRKILERAKEFLREFMKAYM